MKVFSRGLCRLCGVQVDSAQKDVLSVPCHEACADTLLERMDTSTPSEDVEALAEAAYTAQVESIFQEWPHLEQPHVPWSGLQESVKRIHRAAVWAVLNKQKEEG